MCSEVGGDDIVIFIQVCALVHVQAQTRRCLGLIWPNVWVALSSKPGSQVLFRGIQSSELTEFMCRNAKTKGFRNVSETPQL